MAACANCGRKLGFFDPGSAGLCHQCAMGASELITRHSDNFEEDQLELERDIAAILLTTETAPNLEILERIEIVTAECAFGMNIFKDLFAGVRDVIGGRSAAVQKTLRDSRRTALHELKKEAHAVGANAVIAVDLDYTELSAAGNMVLLVASGTAVRIASNPASAPEHRP
nr:YbjQ family protein [Salipiger pallidus]